MGHNQQNHMETRKLELQQGTDDLKIVDVGTDNGDEVGAIFLTGDEDFDQTDRIPLAKEMVKRWNSHEELLAALEALTSAVEGDPEHEEGLPFHYRTRVEEARAAIANAETQEGIYFPS